MQKNKELAEDITVKTNKKKLSVTRSRSNSFDDFSGSAISNDFKNIKNKDFKKSLYLGKNNLNNSL